MYYIVRAKFQVSSIIPTSFRQGVGGKFYPQNEPSKKPAQIRVNIDITISMCTTSIFSSDMKITSYFNISISINIITYSAFNRVFKIFVIALSHYKFFVKIFFDIGTINTVLTFFDHTFNEIVNDIFT